MQKNLAFIIGIISLLAIIGILFTFIILNLQKDEDKTNTKNSVESNIQTLPTNTDSEQILDDVKEYNLSMDSYSYSISTINAKPGETIKINLTNTEGQHDLVIDELNVNSGLVNAGKTVSFEFTIPSSARGKVFEYYCSVSNHRALGMIGKIIVE